MHAGLQVLITRESARRLAGLVGTDSGLNPYFGVAVARHVGDGAETRKRPTLCRPMCPPDPCGMPLNPYVLETIMPDTTWTAELSNELEAEWDDLPETVQVEILAHGKLLEQFGPQLGRPRVDTLKGSKHSNMKELRFEAADGVWRVAFAFDPRRTAILLIAGDKSGRSEKRFYRQLLEKADARFDAHLTSLRPRGKHGTSPEGKARRPPR